MRAPRTVSGNGSSAATGMPSRSRNARVKGSHPTMRNWRLAGMMEPRLGAARDGRCKLRAEHRERGAEGGAPGRVPIERDRAADSEV